ncbi:hypothetical protein Tco_1560774 [Tanacetum coccineum]
MLVDYGSLIILLLACSISPFFPFVVWLTTIPVAVVFLSSDELLLSRKDKCFFRSSSLLFRVLLEHKRLQLLVWDCGVVWIWVGGAGGVRWGAVFVFVEGVAWWGVVGEYWRWFEGGENCLKDVASWKALLKWGIEVL